jgi:hypothetical protein
MTSRCLACTLALTGLSLLACSEDADTTEKPTGSQGGSGGGLPGVACEPTDSTHLEGTWAVLARYSLLLESRQGGVVTMCPVDQVAPASLLFLLDVQPSETGEFDVSAVPCQLDLPSVTAMIGECRPGQGNLLSVVIPIPEPLTRNFAAIPPVQATAILAPSDSLSFDSLRFTWGTRHDSLPGWQANSPGCGMGDFEIGHSSVCEASCVDSCDLVDDDDDDDFPGVTVHVCGTTEDDVSAKVPCNAEEPTNPGVTLQGMIRMALRTQLTLQGDAKSSCEASGTFASDTTYSVVGADAYLTSTRISVASAIQSLPLFEGQTAQSRWRMVRIDGQFGAPDWQLPQDALARCSIARSRRNELE